MNLRHIVHAMARSKTGPLLIAAQIAITLAILVNVVYVIAIHVGLERRPSGLDLDSIFWIVSEGHAPDYDHARVTHADLIYLNSMPGVVAAAASSALPQTGMGWMLGLSPEPEDDGQITPAFVYAMTERAVDTLGLKLIAGRDLRAEAVVPPGQHQETQFAHLAPEIVITQTLATKLFGGESALGKTIHFSPVHRASTVVGIVERLQAAPPLFGSASDMEERVVIAPEIPSGPTALYLVRTEPGRRDEVMAHVEKDFGPTQPGRYIERIETLANTAAAMRAADRTGAIALATVATLVLAVTALGIFGLAAFAVTGRTRQIGIQRAVGARRRDILHYFLLENWLINTVGVAAGSALALAVAVQLATMLSIPRLPLIYVVSGVLCLWMIGLAAVVAPARLAAAVPPAVATRGVV